MKIIIVTEGGYNIGFGHITRCYSIFQGINSVLKEKPRFMIYSEDNLDKFLSDHQLSPKYYNHDNILSYISKLSPDVVIIDSYKLPREIYEGISEKVKTCLYIDDFRRISYPKGIVVNGSIFAQKLKYPAKKSIKYFLGTKYIPIRREFWKIKQRELTRKLQKVLVTLGGTDFNNSTPIVLKYLDEILKGLKIITVVGVGFRNIEKLYTTKFKNEIEFVSSPSPTQLRELMLSSDICISAGGQTTYELASTGTPTIGICASDNQRFNLEGWKKAGFIILA